MKVVFRVDASIEMGTGHVMRCLTLADELKGKGSKILFVTRMHAGNMDDAIKKRGHEIFSLSAPTDAYQGKQDDVAHASWLGVLWEQDVKETCNVIGTSSPDWLIVDHYGIDIRWHKELRAHVGQIMVIDDLADRPLDCEILLDQTYGRQEEDYRQRVSSSCQMILGSHYALLRPRFAELRPKAIEKRKKFNGINRLLVSMGGVDADNVTAKVLKGISKVSWKSEPMIDVVMGDKAPHLNEVIKLAEELPLEIIVSTNVFDMAERMLEADLAIGAGGTTSWERCTLGLPSIVIVTASNQRFLVKELENSGAILALDCTIRLDLCRLVERIESFEKRPVTYKSIAQAAADVCNGSGVWEVTRLLMEH